MSGICKKTPEFRQHEIDEIRKLCVHSMLCCEEQEGDGLEFVSQREHTSIKVFWREVIRESHIKVLSKHHTNVRSYKSAPLG